MLSVCLFKTNHFIFIKYIVVSIQMFRNHVILLLHLISLPLHMRSYSDLPVCATYIVTEQSVNDVLRFTVIISFGFVFLSVRSNTLVLSYILHIFSHSTILFCDP